MVTNKEIMKKLKEIDKNITRSSQIGRLDFLFALGLALIVASIPMRYIAGLKDTFVPNGFLIAGAMLMIGTIIWRKLIKK